MQKRQYNRYQFIPKWCSSETFQSILDFDETLCSQAKSYILRMFEKEYEDNLPDIDSDSPVYDDDMYWIGYLLTYWCFEENVSGKDIIEQYDVCKILDEFDVLHTLSIKSAIIKIREDDKLFATIEQFVETNCSDFFRSPGNPYKHWARGV